MVALEAADFAPLLNVGSSTSEFRSRQQPYVQREIFDPLERRGIGVVYTDLFDGPGVDLAGDLMDDGFIELLRAREPRSVLVSNLLEHVPDPPRVARAILDILPAGAYLFVSGPRDWPYHPDPIDNGLRPSPQQLAALFPGTRLLHGATLASDPVWRWPETDRNGGSLAGTLVRLCLPMYKPRDWVKAMHQVPYLVRKPKAVAVVLRKDA